jgi:hypothetical protein
MPIVEHDAASDVRQRLSHVVGNVGARRIGSGMRYFAMGTTETGTPRSEGSAVRIGPGAL